VAPAGSPQALSGSALSLPAGPPLGVFGFLVPAPRGFAVGGWVLDPETALPIDVKV
jgi:hypothetical protein